MLSLRAHVWICAGLLVALFAIPILGNAWTASGGVMPGAMRLPFMICYFGLFLAFGLSAIPVMVKFVLRGRDANEPLVGTLIRHQDAIVWVLWILILGGLAVALPEMIRDGFFTPVGP
ncbi:MAG TPA: hypothetical protein VG889_22280 [Rhizomicrobium sp.]|nr:hypothetical protein [Rhizomicrobium sp.]